MAQSIGKVSQIIGPVVDVDFSGKNNPLPKIYDALEITKEDGSKLILEVQSHIGEETVRTVSMDSTDGLSRGVKAFSLGNSIQMPVGDEIYGRLFNVIGDAIDGMENLPKMETMVFLFTVKPQHLKIFQPQLKFYLLELK